MKRAKRCGPADGGDKTDHRPRSYFGRLVEDDLPFSPLRSRCRCRLCHHVRSQRCATTARRVCEEVCVLCVRARACTCVSVCPHAWQARACVRPGEGQQGVPEPVGEQAARPDSARTAAAAAAAAQGTPCVYSAPPASARCKPQANECRSVQPRRATRLSGVECKLRPTTEMCLMPCVPSIGPHARGETHASIIELSGCAPPIQPMMCLASKCTVPASPSVPAVPTHTALRRNNPMRQRPVPFRKFAFVRKLASCFPKPERRRQHLTQRGQWGLQVGILW